MPNEIKIKLTKAMNENLLVRLIRSFKCDDSAHCDGFVIHMSDQLILLHQLSDRIDLDGFCVVRVSDLTEIQFDFPTGEMARKVLRLRKISPAGSLAIDLGDMKDALVTAEKLFPLIVIEREIVAKGECEIGQLKLVSDESYALRWITPNAEWVPDKRTYRIRDITRLQFGGEYEGALALAVSL